MEFKLTRLSWNFAELVYIEIVFLLTVKYCELNKLLLEFIYG